jgi:hypothetical protein
MIFQDKALSEASMYFLKILLSLSGAVMLATLPGFLDINYGMGGLSVRAAGGAAAFVFIYTQSPHLPALKSTVAPHYPMQSTRPGPTSSNDSFGEGSFPFLVALTLDPFGFLQGPSTLMADTTYAGAPAGPGQTILIDNGGDIGVDGGDTILIDTPGTSQSAVIHTVSTVFNTIYEASRDVVTYVVEQAVAAVDQAAAAMRTAVAWIGTKTVALIDALLPPGTVPTAQIYEFVAELPERMTELLNTAVAPAVEAIGTLTIQLGSPAETLAHVGETVRAAPEALGATVRETVEAVPEMLNGTVSTVNSTVNGLTSTVGETLTSTTGAVTDLVSGVLHSPKDAVALTTQAVGYLTDTVVNGVGDQVKVITETLNEVTPALVEKINPDFDKQLAATSRLREAGDRVLGSAGQLSSAVDHTASLPPLSDVNVSGLTLPQTPVLRDNRLLQQVTRSEGVPGGCGSCMLPPMQNTASVTGPLDVHARGNGRLGTALSSGSGSVAGISGGIGAAGGLALGSGSIGGGTAILGPSPVLGGGGGSILGPAPALGGGSGSVLGAAPAFGGGGPVGGGASAIGSGGGSLVSGPLPSAGGPSGGASAVSSAVGSVGGNVSRTTKGLLGGRR